MTIMSSSTDRLPVKCTTCGNILTKQYSSYIYTLRAYRSNSFSGIGLHRAVEFEDVYGITNVEQSILDRICISNKCCSRHICYLAKKHL